MRERGIKHNKMRKVERENEGGPRRKRGDDEEQSRRTRCRDLDSTVGTETDDESDAGWDGSEVGGWGCSGGGGGYL